MSSYKEIAERYAKKIKKAVRETELPKTASLRLIKKAFLETDPLLEELKHIYNELNRMTYEDTGVTISEDDKKRILVLTGQVLNLSKPDIVERLVKCANNENAIELVDHISELLNEVEE